MKAIVFDTPGDESVLKIGDAQAPTCGADDVRIRVRAAAINRADLLQRRGMYPPPPGASTILGMECAGEIIELGARVREWKLGDRVMALMPGGGYAEEACAHAGSVMPIPSNLSFTDAAAIPEVFLTAFLNLFWLGEIDAGETALVHGGSSGVGTAAIQLLRELGAQPIVTVRTEEKAARCRELGAQTIIYSREDFLERARALTGGAGVDVVLDCMGASYFERNLQALKVGGRLVIIGLQGGVQSEINLGALLARRISVIGSTLRARSAGDKEALVRAFRGEWLPRFESGALKPIIDRVLPLTDAKEAHRLMAASDHVGKIVLSVA